MKLEEKIFAYVVSESEGNGCSILSARTPGGTLPLRFWNGENRPKPGDYLLLEALNRKGAEEEFQRWKSLSLDSKYNKPVTYGHRVLAEDEIPPEIKNKINRDRRPQLQAAMEVLKDESQWKDGELHGKLLKFVGENDEKFFTAPAATDHHHNWKGGLLVHTAEVASNCKAILDSPMNRFYEINADALLLAAWFHDTGKMLVYRMNGDLPDIDGEKEKKIGHPTISNLIFSDFARREGLDSEIAELASHCILSHHERREWGAVVEPRTIEAHILCRADYISSRMPD